MPSQLSKCCVHQSMCNDVYYRCVVFRVTEKRQRKIESSIHAGHIENRLSLIIITMKLCTDFIILNLSLSFISFTVQYRVRSLSIGELFWPKTRANNLTSCSPARLLVNQIWTHGFILSEQWINKTQLQRLCDRSGSGGSHWPLPNVIEFVWKCKCATNTMRFANANCIR